MRDMSYQSYTVTPTEEWQDYILWEDDGFKNPTVTRGDIRHSFLGTGVSGIESPYVTSAPPSNYGEPSSFECNVSAPPSITGGASSYGQPYGTSPTFSSTATSPLVGRDELRYYGSFGGCDDLLSPLHAITESPLIDTTRDRIFSSTSSLATTAGRVFNPHLAGSSHSFSEQDMVTSQILTSNSGTWADQAWTGEAIPEGDENGVSTATAPIPILRAQTQSFSNSFESFSPSQSFYDGRTRAITIPQPNLKITSHSAKASRNRWTPNAPPILSTSPISHRRPRSATLSRSSSRAEQRKVRASPSPTSAQSLGFVMMQMDSQSGRMAAASSSEGSQGRVAKGRKKGLEPKQRNEAALMRIIGSCSNCKKRKEKCDPGTPCQSCLKHFKGDLINNPCRNQSLANLAMAFLSDQHAWHPTERSIESLITPREFSVATNITYKIPVHFGFGLPMSLDVSPILLQDRQSLVHEHLVYAWPPRSSTTTTHTQAVLPAILSPTTVSGLEQILDNHLERLVLSEFKAFPPYVSPLRILHKVYTFFRSLSRSSDASRLLLQALKLLVLVHVGGDITLPRQSEDVALSQLIRSTMNVADDYRPSPCFIRSQFGAMMPKLADRLMREVLLRLEGILASRNSEYWPLALATNIVLLMTVESIHYHAAKLPYHDAYDCNHVSASTDNSESDENAVATMLAYYTSCFSACHTRLQSHWQGDLATAAGQRTSSDQFIRSVREAKTSSEAYLEHKVLEKKFDGDDMGFYFDRLVARLLLLKS